MNEWKITENFTLPSWIFAVSLILLSLASYFVLAWVSTRFRKNKPNTMGKLAWSIFRYPVLAFILVIDFIILQAIFSAGMETPPVVSQLITIALIFCTTWMLIRGINLARELILRQYDISEKDNLKARKVYTQFRILERIIIFILILIAIAIALMSFDGIRRIGISLFASAGVA